MHVRSASRFQILAALVITSLLVYSVWIHSSTLDHRLENAWAGPAKRIVVFGDSFSTAAGGRVTKGTSEHEETRWTDVLLKELGFDVIHNYACAAADKTIGAVTDNDIYANATRSEAQSAPFLPDFKQQVQTWMKDMRMTKNTKLLDEYVITITLGFWDVWEYAQLDLSDAKAAVMNSVHSIFEQMHVIADSVDANITIVLPQLWDASFTPKFMSSTNTDQTPARSYSDNQHKLIYLSHYWNMALSQYAAACTAGDLYVPEWNIWLLDQIRAVQMKKVGIFDALGHGAETPAFKDVSSPCLKTVPADGSNEAMIATSVCERPRQYLWWDDTQFSSFAHELLGGMTAKLVKTNGTANAGANDRPSAEDVNITKIAAPRLIPSLAPGS